MAFSPGPAKQGDLVDLLILFVGKVIPFSIHVCRWMFQVYDELQKIVEKSELPEMSRFTNLRDRILEVVCGVLKRCLAPTNQMIHNIIQVSG